MANKPRLHTDRRNNDGSYDSTGLNCFATVGGFSPEGGVAEPSRAHICDSAFLAERGILTRAEVTRQVASSPTGTQSRNHRGRAA